jgi:hypothetical protein
MPFPFATMQGLCQRSQCCYYLQNNELDESRRTCAGRPGMGNGEKRPISRFCGANGGDSKRVEIALGRQPRSGRNQAAPPSDAPESMGNPGPGPN